MGKLLRVLAIVVGVVVTLMVVLSLALSLFVDPNDFKNQISEQVSRATGRELVIEGDVGLSIFPWLAVELGETRLSNAKGFGEAPFARVREAQVRVKLLPLLRKRVEMDTVVLDGLELNLMRDARGRGNWEDLTAGKAETGTPASGQGSAGSAAPLAGLALGGLRLSNARLSWDDRQAGSRYVLEELSLSAGAVAPQVPFDVSFNGRLKGGKPAMEAAISLSGELWLSESLQQLRISPLSLSVDARGEGLPGGATELQLTSPLELDLARQSLDLPALDLRAYGLKLQGKLQGSEILADKRRFKGSLKVDEFIPRELLKALGKPAPVTADASVLGKADASLELVAGSDYLKLSSLSLRLDDTRLKGHVGVRNFAAPALSFDLTGDVIDLDRYLPPPAQGKPAPPASPGAAAAGAAGAGALPVEALRGLNLDGVARFKEFKAFGLRSTDIDMTIKANGGRLRVHPASANMYGGRYDGDITVDASGATPRLAMNEKVAGVQAGPLLKDLMGNERLSAVADVQVTLSGSGKDITAMRKTLNGNAAFSLREGAVKGVDILGIIRKAQQAQALLQGQPPVAAPAGSERTEFTELRGTATITNGLVRNDDLSGNSPLLKVSGKGQADLVAETIDYRLITEILGGDGTGGGLKGLLGRPIPVHIGGTFSKPTYGADLQAALKTEVEKRVKEKVEEKIQDKLQDKIGDQLQDKLKGLFGR